MNSGIYKIENIINSKIYIGSSSKLNIRFNTHKHDLKVGRHGNSYLQNAWNKYGEKCFKFSIIEIVKDVKLLEEREQYWCDFYSKTNELYNIRICSNSNIGLKRSAESRKKMSEAHLGKPSNVLGIKHTDEARYNMSLSHLGKSSGMKGKKHTDKAKSKMGNNSFLGKHHTEETKKKQSDAHKGKKLTEEHIENMRKANLGKRRTEETKQKISNTLKGRVFTEEHRKNISIGKKRSNSEKRKKR